MEIPIRCSRFITLIYMLLLFGCSTATISKNLLITPYAINREQTGEFRQAYTIGGRGTDWGSSILRSSDGFGYAVFGYSIKSFGESTDFLAVKMSPTWEPVWARTYGGTYKEVFYAAINTSDRGYVMLGDTLSMFNTPLRVYSTHYPSPRPLLVKIDGDGNVKWARIVCCNSRSIYETGDGSYVVAGELYHRPKFPNKFSVRYPSDIILTKLNRDGTVKWSKTYRADSSTFGSTVREARDGSILIGGAIQVSSTNKNVLLVKVSSDGSFLWSKTYEYDSNQGIYDMLETEDRGWLLMGPQKSGNSQNSILLFKVSSTGDILWSNLYNSSGNHDLGAAMIHGYGSTYLIVGRSDSIEEAGRSEEKTKGAILFINEKGQIITSTHFSPATVFMSAAMVNKEEYVLVGTHEKSDRWRNSMFIANWLPTMASKDSSAYSAKSITLFGKSVLMFANNEKGEDEFI